MIARQHGVGRAHIAQSGLERLRLAAEDGGVHRGVGQHALDVIAGFGNGNVFGEDGAGQQRLIGQAHIAPAQRPPRPGVVARGGQRLGAIELLQQPAEVGAAELHIHPHVGDLVVAVIGQADLARHQFGGGRHELHQPRSAHPRLDIGDKARLLPDQAVEKSLVHVFGRRGLADGFTVRHGVALGDVHPARHPFAGVDAAIPELLLAGQFGCALHLLVVEPAQRKIPFAHRLVAQVDAEQGQRALQPRPRRLLRNDRQRRRGQGSRQADLHAQRVGSELAVKIPGIRHLGQQRAALDRVAEFFERAGVPVAPRQIFVALIDQRARGAAHQRPVLRAQRGAHLPFEHRGRRHKGRIGLAHAGIPAGGFGLQTQRGRQTDASPDLGPVSRG